MSPATVATNCFKAFRFPLFDMSKEQMRIEATNAAWKRFMATHLFCHRTIDDEPCGICNPRIYTIQEGLATNSAA